MSSATTWLPCVFLPPPKLKHGVFFSSCSRASTLPPSCSSFNYLLTLILTFIRGEGQRSTFGSDRWRSTYVSGQTTF